MKFSCVYNVFKSTNRIFLLSAILVTHGSLTPLMARLQTGDETDVLARIGPRTISVREYLERIDLMPWPGKENPGTRDSAKIRALASLVAEKLMSMQAIDQGFVQNENTMRSLKALERLFARDELYRIEVAGKVTVSPGEVAEGLKRYASVILLNSYVMDSEDNARLLANVLNNQWTNASVSVPTQGILSHDTISVSIGDLREHYEAAAYAIDSVGEARAVFSPEEGWAVFQLLGTTTSQSYAQATVSERETIVQRKIRSRKEGERALEFSRGIFAANVRLDSSGFIMLADTLRSILLQDSASHRQESFFLVTGDDIDSLKKKLAPSLGRTLVSMGDHAVSLEEIIDEMRFFPVRFSSLRRNAFLQSLNSGIQVIAEAGILSDEAFLRGMQNRPNVRTELSDWGDALQADKLLRHFLDSLGQAFGTETGSSDDTSDTNEHHSRKAVETVNNYLAKLAERYQVEIYFDKLKTVNINPSNMVTRRYIGFGGMMMGVPTLLRLWDWLDTWRAAKDISP